jgi:hypothetical protein
VLAIVDVQNKHCAFWDVGWARGKRALESRATRPGSKMEALPRTGIGEEERGKKNSLESERVDSRAFVGGKRLPKIPQLI